MAESLNATFFAFKKRPRGGVLVGASISLAVILFVSLIAFGVGLSTLMGFGPAGMFRNPAMAAGDPSVVLNNVGFILLLELVYLFFFFIALASYEAACLRWMIRGERPGLFGMTLNADTWRVYSTYWLWLVFFIVGYVALVLLIIVLGFLASIIGRDNPSVGLVAGIAVALICAAAPVYVLVRMAPASATSVGRERFSFFDAWKVSRGRFWALFGAYFLLWLIYVIIACAMWGTWFATMVGPDALNVFNMRANPAGASQAWTNALTGALSSPAGLGLYWGLQIAGYAVWMFFSVMLNGVNARAVLAAADDGKIDGVVSAGLAKTFE